MRHRHLLLISTAIAISAAVSASGASAKMVTEGRWYTGSPTTTLPIGSSKSLNCSVGEHNGESKLVLTITIGEGSGTPVRLTAAGVECIGAKIFDSKDEKNGVVMGTDSGRLRFTGVTISEPAGCTVKGGTIETEELHSELYMEEGVSGKWFDRFEPALAGGNITVITIEGTCAAKGNRIMKGFFYGEAANPTGVAARVQPLTFSPEIDATTGSELRVAGNPAHLTGRINTRLVPEEEFGAK